MNKFSSCIMYGSCSPFIQLHYFIFGCMIFLTSLQYELAIASDIFFLAHSRKPYECGNVKHMFW